MPLSISGLIDLHSVRLMPLALAIAESGVALGTLIPTSLIGSSYVMEPNPNLSGSLAMIEAAISLGIYSLVSFGKALYRANSQKSIVLCFSIALSTLFSPALYPAAAR